MSIHGVSRADEPIESFRGPVLPLLHRSDDLCERSEISVLHSQRVLLEERNHRIGEIAQPADREGHHRAVRSFAVQVPAAEVGRDPLEHIAIRLVLGHLEDWRELPASGASGIRLVAVDAHREAPLAVDEPNDPPRIESLMRFFGFLLIVRTDRIFTIHATKVSTQCDTNEYRRILGCSSIQPGFTTAVQIAVQRL